ncbi:hypothetical protein COU18_01640 [Candidatus Kaiserbacteria bacterium CG10_big_fil_rev_8_21_14_0_10_51_14]|uniref:Uncharacterized protein n=1 Tax=Candidatus Kaiserbacteria bacterium CG10_big_fil_rev_8_21_14_0_10_51_14 TaxID=1974610 RepID=A0A2H0UCC7_9BACT|nr:MAG: hypothetical protein COU18_01640 [Candidatus Kaiserbacteria bacterium CG10_big_fil_rev_8_21_14_0_10_51_14]
MSEKVVPLMVRDTRSQGLGELDDAARVVREASEILESDDDLKLNRAYEHLHRALMGRLHAQTLLVMLGQAPLTLRPSPQGYGTKEWACRNVVLEILAILRKEMVTEDDRLYCVGCVFGISSRLEHHIHPDRREKTRAYLLSSFFNPRMVDAATGPIVEGDMGILDR